MSDSSKTHSTTKARRHITTACHPCREDKIKCDGAVPECRQCTVKNRSCTYAGIDRRKLSLRKAVEAFSQRVRQLESFIKAHDLAVPPTDQGHQATLDQLSSLYAPETCEPDGVDKGPSPVAFHRPQSIPDLGRVGPSAPAVDMMSSPQASRDFDPYHVAPASLQTAFQAPEIAAEEPFVMSSPDFSMTMLPFNHFFDVDWVWNHSMVDYMENDIDLDGLQPPVQRPNDHLSEADPRSSSSDPSPPTLLNDDESTDDEDHSVVTNELSHRLGSLLMTDNGERHFYGATSNLNLARGGNLPVMYSNRSDKCQKAQTRLEATGLDEEMSRSLENHLVQLFFTWHNPSLYIVDEAIFTKAREEFEHGKQDTLFYSPFLMNAMCAVGAAFETNKHPGLPTPLAEFFANRAAAVLDIELQHPRISTVQALTILSSHEAASTRDTQGWLYSGQQLVPIPDPSTQQPVFLTADDHRGVSGMAMRLAVDFGLHVSTKAYVEAGSMSAEEARGRSVAFWGSYATDHMWGLYLGRPLHNISLAVTVETPMAFSAARYRNQVPCLPLGGNNTGKESLNFQELFVEQWVQLPKIMSPLEGSLYFEADASKVDLVKLAQRTLEHLLYWRGALPREFEVDVDSPSPPKCSPHVLILHMLYEYLIILLHRPFVAKRYIQPHPLIGKGPEHAREMCVRSASRISILLSLYEEQHSLSQVNVVVVQITFSAALILVYATVSERDIHNHRRLTGHLEMCCRALAELGHVFNNAARTLDVLLHVKRTWQARLVAASAGSKRRASFAAGSPTKRRTTSDVTRV